MAAKRKAAAEATSAAARGVAAAQAAEVGLGAGASAAETAEMAATARTARMARALDPAAAITSIRWLVVGGGGEKVLEGGGIMGRERAASSCSFPSVFHSRFPTRRHLLLSLSSLFPHLLEGARSNPLPLSPSARSAAACGCPGDLAGRAAASP